MRKLPSDVYLFLCAAVAMAILAAPVPLYWDSSGYVVQAMTGQVGGLGFGRPVFVLISHAVARTWFAVGGSAATLEPVLRIWWAAVSCMAAPLTWRLARSVSLTFRASALAGLAVALSPAMAHVGGSVLTDGPATSMCVLADLLGIQAVFAVWNARPAPSRRAVLLGGAAGVALGLAVGLREQSVVSAAALALLLPIAPRGDRARIGLAMLVAGATTIAVPMLYVWLTQPGYLDTVRTWLHGMAHDRAIRPFGLRDAAVFGAWIASLGPVMAYAAADAWCRRASSLWRVGGALFAVSFPALFMLAAASAFRGIDYSPRFLLPSLPAAVAIPGAWTLDRWMRASRSRFLIGVAAVSLPLVIAAPFVHERSAPIVATVRTLPSRLAALPTPAVIVTGQACPTIALDRAVAAHDLSAPAPGWEGVCPGWAWPADLPASLNQDLRGGDAVVLDLRPSAWIGEEQLAALADLRAYTQTLASAGSLPSGLIVWQ